MNNPWFPGHMRKALTQISKKATKNNRILLLVDSRLPQTSLNNEFMEEQTFANVTAKDIRLIFTKIDLISREKKQLLRRMHPKSYFADYQKKNYVNYFIKWLKNIFDKDSFFCSCFVIGIPNVGKSTFIKRHCIGKQVEVNRKPGSTKGITKIKMTSTISLYDTPGISFKHRLDEQSTAKLILCNLIKPDQYDLDMVVRYGLSYLFTQMPKIFADLFPKTTKFINKNNLENSSNSLYELINQAYFQEQMTNSAIRNNWILRRIQSKAHCEWE